MYVNEHVKDISGIDLGGKLDLSCRARETNVFTQGPRPYHLGTVTITGLANHTVCVYEPNSNHPDYETIAPLSDALINFCKGIREINAIPPSGRPSAVYEEVKR